MDKGERGRDGGRVALKGVLAAACAAVLHDAVSKEAADLCT